MKLFLVVCLSSLLSVEVFAIVDLIDSVDDVEALVNDDTKMKAIFKCMLDLAPCGEFQKWKDQIPNLILTNCSECNPKQKEKFNLGYKLTMEKHPKELEQVVLKYVGKSK